MKNIFFWYIAIFFAAIPSTQAQNAIKETFDVAGNCGMCKQRIEKAGKDAGASHIIWNPQTGKAEVTFDNNNSSLSKIKEAIAAAGHDTDEFKAPDAVYDALHTCCLYERMDEDADTTKNPSSSNVDKTEHHDHDHEVRGVVVNESENGDLKPIQGATVYWVENPEKKVQSDKDGIFKIMHEHDYKRLVVSHTAMQADTLEVTNLHEVLVVQSKNNVLKEIVVSRRQKSNYISRMNATRVETLTARELFKAACCDLSESFETNASVDVVSSDAVTGSKQIQMLGLSGIYTQLTVEGLPGPRGFAIPLGLNSISGSWIESINISKGIGSVVNGFENMAGQINVELKKPHNTDRLYFNAYANNMGRTDVNLNVSQQLSDNWSVGFLLHDNFMYNRHMNFSNNGFRDIPVGNLFSGVNRWHYQNDHGVIVQFGVKYLNDNRIGGEIDFDKSTDQFTTNRYGLGFVNKRIEGFAKVGYVFPTNLHRSIGLQLSASNYDQESFFGLTGYNNNHSSGYANLIFQDVIGSEAHKYKVGASLQYDKYREDLFYTSPSINYQMGRQERVTGVFGEYTYSPAEKLDVVLGLRQDHNNLYGWFTTPRGVIRYQPTSTTTLRLSSGRGQRTANIFAENLGIFASSRTIANLDGIAYGTAAYGLRPEVSWNTGFSADQDFQLFGREAGISVELFHNNFQNQVVIDWENPREVGFYNLEGKSFSNSLQTELRFMPIQHMEARFAYRYLDVQTDYQTGRLQKPLIAKHRGFMNLGYNTHAGWSFDYTLNVVGHKRIPPTTGNPAQYQLQDRSQAYVTMNAQVSKTFGKNKNFDVYVGGENLSNFFQQDPILAFDQPFGSNFDTNMLWGPLTGRMFYTGIRYHIK
ncbi:MULTISPECIES: TonB-dependent receptor domain-containing protein [Sphingobacterium]|uniref:TonB-dependent receptor domain-containing protein n=1 Tax=Sphingobacterium populi TaxID=1812824 RepID=A0ABW5UDX3_9SPHI|nr:TonB-dependent receptor [Sphingobacterium sp. CFCC 11742]